MMVTDSHQSSVFSIIASIGLIVMTPMYSSLAASSANRQTNTENVEQSTDSVQANRALPANAVCARRFGPRGVCWTNLSALISNPAIYDNLMVQFYAVLELDGIIPSVYLSDSHFRWVDNMASIELFASNQEISDIYSRHHGRPVMMRGFFKAFDSSDSAGARAGRLYDLKILGSSTERARDLTTLPAIRLDSPDFQPPEK